MKRRRIGFSICLCLMLFLAQNKAVFAKDYPFYDPNAVSCSGSSFATPNNTASPDEIQITNAKIVMGIAKTNKLDKQGALIGLMVALAESGLQNYANSKIPVSLSFPHDAEGSDYDSVGIFQQRVVTGWSTLAPGNGPASDTQSGSQNYSNGFPDAIKQVMTPSYAAQAFFGSPPGSNAPSALSKGLQNISGWQSLSPGQAAQRVQISGTADGSNYTRQQNAAQILINKYWDDAPAIPLPVAVTGGTVPTSGDNARLASCSLGTGSINGCLNPFVESGWGLFRTDQGVDYQPNALLPVRAICDGKILSTDGSGWPGGYFMLIKLTSGPFAGKCMYVAENLTDVLPAGTQVTAGQQIATALPTYPFTEWGWAAGPQTPSTPYNGAPNGTAMPGGKAFARFIRNLGGQTQDDPGDGPQYEGNSCL